MYCLHLLSMLFANNKCEKDEIKIQKNKQIEIS